MVQWVRALDPPGVLRWVFSFFSWVTDFVYECCRKRGFEYDCTPVLSPCVFNEC